MIMSTPDFAVVCWKWKPNPGYRSTFGPETVNVLQRMVKRHFKRPHRFICVTDDPTGIDPDVEIVPLWDTHSTINHPAGDDNPSCYRRLRMFAADAGKMFGPRFVSLDLDCVITKDVGPLWDRTEDFVIWGDTNPTTPYNGSMILHTAGTRTKLWTEFDPVETPRKTRAMRLFGSDQAWIAACLGPNEARWRVDDGVYSFRNHIAPNGFTLPEHARIVFFHGRHDPWAPEMGERIPWIGRHYL